MQKSDIFVLSSSLSEGFSLAMLEAINAQIPLICSKNCWGKEIIEKYWVGEIFQPFDINDLSDKISRILKNKYKYLKKISENYETIKEDYLYEKLALKILENDH